MVQPWSSHLKYKCAVLCKPERIPIRWPHNPTTRCVLKRNETCPHKSLDADVPSRFTHNLQRLEATQMSSNQWMDRQTVPIKGISAEECFSVFLKRRNIDTHSSISLTFLIPSERGSSFLWVTSYTDKTVETGKRAVVVCVGVKGDVSYKGAQGKVREVLSLFYILVWWWLHDSMCLSKLIELDSKRVIFLYIWIIYINLPPKSCMLIMAEPTVRRSFGSLMTSWNYHTCPSI